ncbi:MAG TPA: DUF6498-containing protein [Burkholderiaceae bacterium]|nr:DUF6498-containing protein [Burkholderiaceae bacterium]
MDEAGKWRLIDIALAVAATVIVVYGVLVLGWSIFVVIALFWFENVLIGVFNVAKMLTSGVRMGSYGLIAALALATFFTVHYGMFTVGHGSLVISLFGQTELGSVASGLFAPLGRMLDYLLADRDGWFAAVGITLLQAAAFCRWWVATRAQPAPLPALMFAPYGRIIILHITIIVSGILVAMLKLPVLGALLLVALKLAFDIAAASTSGQQPFAHRGRLNRFDISPEDDARRP